MAEQPGITFAVLLRRLRDDAQLTQEELADAASLSPRSVSDLERGVNRSARKVTAQLLARALNLEGQAQALFVAAARGLRPAEDEQGLRLSFQIQRTGKQLGGYLASGAVDSALQVAHRPRTEAGRVRQLLLRQLRVVPQPAQQHGESHSRLLRHAPLPLTAPGHRSRAINRGAERTSRQGYACVRCRATAYFQHESADIDLAAEIGVTSAFCALLVPLATPASLARRLTGVPQVSKRVISTRGDRMPAWREDFGHIQFKFVRFAPFKCLKRVQSENDHGAGGPKC